MYQKDPLLKKEDVEKLLDWLGGQHHLPKITEEEAIFFLSSCYYSDEAAKITIDNFYTMKTLSPEVFGNEMPQLPDMQKCQDYAYFGFLPNKTPEGYIVFLAKLLNSDTEAFNFGECIRLWDMTTMLHLHQNGPVEGLRIVIDLENVVFGHLTKLGILTMKKFLLYLQDAAPVRLKGYHYVNTVSFMDKILALMKPFMKKELLEILHLHSNVDGIKKFVPIDCFPSDYGGKVESIASLHAKTKKNLMENVAFFEEQNAKRVDESKRAGKPKSASDIYGVEGDRKSVV